MLRKAKSITCRCGWYIRFRGVDISSNTVSNPVVITYVCGVHSNPCDPSYVDQFVMARTRSGDCEYCADQ